MSLGSELRAVRQRKGYSLRAIARAAGISASYLSDIERDKRTQPDDIVQAICDAMHVDVDVMMALAGRLDAETQDYLQRRQPAAGVLLRAIAAAQLDEDELRSLAAYVERLR
jgi:transcriptional regulator with XRE-family HTH domain